MDSFLKDLLAFITMAKSDAVLSNAEILANVCHDISGMLEADEHFLPRCDGHYDDYQARRNTSQI